MHRHSWIACLFLLVHPACTDSADKRETVADQSTGPSSGGSASTHAATSSGSVISNGSGRTVAPDGGSSGSSGAAGRAGTDTGSAGSAGQVRADGGGLPGCPPSPCDAYQNEADCERSSDRHVGCVWAEVRIVPEGDVECTEGFTELRCLEMLAGGPGSCVVSSLECNEGAPLFVQ